MTINKIVLFIFLSFFFLEINAQVFAPKIENYTSNDYGKNNNSQNWSVNKSYNGDILFGNNNKVIRFNGEGWMSIETTANSGYITSILSDSNKIFVGGQGEFGYLQADQNKYNYVSLNIKVDSNYNAFSNIWKILKYKEGILFFSQEFLFYYKNDSVITISPTTSFHNIFIIDDELYVRQRNIGLMKYKNHSFELISNGEIFKDYGVFGMFKNKIDNRILVVSQEIGLYTIEDKGLQKLESKYENALNTSLVWGGTLLKDNNIALNTALNGVIVIDFKGNIKYIFNKRNGLADNDIKQIYQDDYNDLWLATNTGISKIYYTSQISYFDNSTGIVGRIKKITSFNDNIYIGTSTGLYVKDTTELFFEIFNKLNINESVLSLETSGNYLFIGTKNNLYVLNKINNKIQNIEETDASALSYDKEKKHLFVVGEKGLTIYSVSDNSIKKIKNDNWFSVHNALSLVIDKTDKGKIQLWVGTLIEGVINYTIDSLLNINFTIYKGIADGLSDGWSISYKYNQSFLIGTNSGLMSFIDAETIKLAANDTNLQNIKGIFDLSGLYQDTLAYNDFIQKYNKIWSRIDGDIVVIDEKNKEIIDKNFASLDLGVIRTIFPENKNLLWVGGDNGLALINLEKIKNISKKPDIKINTIYSGDSLFISDIFLETNTLSIDYQYNSLNFVFSSLSNKDGKKALYSYKLEGYDREWSKWSRINSFAYKKIDDGAYTFLVKAKDIYGNESKISKISFVINPPWYKTIWAYIIYLILFIFLVVVIVKLSIRRLKAKNEELERIVKERTKEISNQRDELAEQKKEIEDSINYAKRIQQAVLPHNEYIEEILHEHFILFKPKDVVSGDFYWTLKVKNKIIITAADCTGHGVPGAFMSMLGVSFLNQIVRVNKVIQANQILIELRKNIIHALKQKGLINEQKDGMDMALCIIDTEALTVDFSGANNPLYVIKNKDLPLKDEELAFMKLFEDSKSDFQNSKLLYEVKPSKMPIAIYEKMDDFRSHKIQLNKGDMLYMFSDGFPDQFGGPKGKKFKYKPFKRLLLENSDKPMSEQKEVLEKSILEWMNGYEQIDDIVVVGIKL